MSQLPQRKNARLKNYDYSQNGYYFITICIKDKQCILWDNHVGAPTGRPQLSHIGIKIENAIENIPNIYINVSINNYIIMPNHIHMIIVLQDNDEGRAMHAPTISQIINQFKGFVTKQIGYPYGRNYFMITLSEMNRNIKKYMNI